MFRSPRRITALGAAALLVIVVLLAIVLSSARTPATRYYVALGDSLSVGIQPDSSGMGVRTGAGYVDDIYAHYARQIAHLKLVEMGCPGDDTANVLTGQGNAAAATLYHCDRSGGSQLRAAVAFIRAHRSQVRLVSIDIGANDVNDCLNATVLSKGLGPTVSCVNRGEQSVAANTPKILGALRAAAAPGTGLVGGTLYDPFLAGLLSGNKTLRAIARQTLVMITRLNSEIAYADAASGFRTADVAGMFDTYDTRAVQVAALGGRQPRNVAVLCRATWICARPPRGPNVHPNSVGYRLIARAYEAALGRL